MIIEGLRSPHAKVGPIVYFGRMLDKIRLHAAGKLPDEYVPNLGDGFDKRCVDFLGIEYAALVKRTNDGGGDEELLAWSNAQGRPLTDEDYYVWNEFMRKRGWNDEGTERLLQRKGEGGFTTREDIQTMFQYIDADEAE
jgi:hypothetical protein